MLEEAGESPLKPLVNEVEKRRKLADEKIDMVDKLLQIMSDAEKDYDSSFKEFLRKIETPSDDMESLTTSLDLFMESSSGLLEVFENAKDFVEKP